MAHCGQVYQLSRSCFRSSHIEITILGLKIERQNTNQCLSGLRIKDQGVQSAQTFPVKSFFFLQQPRKHDDQSAFKKVLNSDRGFGAASQTLETKMVMYIITAKLNLTFRMIGKATAVKRLQKWSGRNSSCRFSVKNY